MSFVIVPLVIITAAIALVFCAIHWAVSPPTKRQPARLLFSYLGGVFGLFLSLVCFRWVSQFQMLLLKFTPQAFANFMRMVYPVVYLFGAWALGFVVTFHLLGRIDKPDRPDDPEQ